MVFALCVEGCAAARPRARTAAVERFEKIAEIRRVPAAKFAAAKFETPFHVRRRTEFLPGLPVRPQLIVSRSFFRIFQHLVGFAQFLEARLGIGILADIGVVFTRQFSVGALDLVLGRVALDPHGPVIVFVFHLRPLKW